MLEFRVDYVPGPARQASALYIHVNRNFQYNLYMFTMFAFHTYRFFDCFSCILRNENSTYLKIYSILEVSGENIVRDSLKFNLILFCLS